MYLIYQPATVILILYLKLNCFNSIPLIERHKSSPVSVSVSGLIAIPESDNSNANPNITHNKSTRTATITTKTTAKTREKDFRKNAFQTNPIDELTTKPTPMTTTPITTLTFEQPATVNELKMPDSDNTLIDSNQKKIINYDRNGVADDKNNNNKNNSTNGSNNNIINNSNKNSSSTKSAKRSIETSAQSDKIDDYYYDDDTDDLGDLIYDETELSLGKILNKTLDESDVDRFLWKYQSDKDNTCFLDLFKTSLMWWAHQNGTLKEEAILNVTKQECYLDLSFRNISLDDLLYKAASTYLYFNDYKVIAFSAAENNLTRAPYRTLLLLSKSLKYLTLKGNQFFAFKTGKTREAFKHIVNRSHGDDDTNEPQSEDDTNNQKKFRSNFGNNETTTKIHRSKKETFSNIKRKLKLGAREDGIAWATFPPMPLLTELDISNCQIEFVTRDAFRNLTRLKRLHISHNKMLTIPYDTFANTPALQYLDLSYTNVLQYDYDISVPTLDAIYNLIYGVRIQQTTFRFVPELIYLDLSHTKLTRNSAVAFTHLGDKVRYMSLCYTSFPLVGNALFKNTALVGLDLSGNPYAAYNVMEDAFEGVADTLRYLYFEHSNIKDLAWLKYLSNLHVLGLSGNNINYLSLETFGPLKGLQLLDLSSNHIGNWYSRVFTQNEQLRVLSLRDNNINILTSEMLRDFQLLDYLSLGDNNFVCDCILRDFVDIAVANNRDADCSNDVLHQAHEILADNADLVGSFATYGYSLIRPSVNFSTIGDATIAYDISKLIMQRYMGPLRKSYENIKQLNRRPKIHVALKVYRALNDISLAPSQCHEPGGHVVSNEKLNSSAMKFQLLDYEDEHYWCFNETERLNFVQLNCQPRNFDDLTEQLSTLTNYVVGTIVSILGVFLIAVVVYFKRWHIHYYFSYLKSAALVSVAAKDAVDQLNALAESDPHLVYDIFISYCQNDRQWVMDELLPNVEETGDVSICLHERDFQIGLTILDNIVSCMDRSRALMLIISSNFLLSHWCQFEMHLAQHRIFEVNKEHLILVFLEDIPRNKRPKTLQYLMDVKTYIKWPSTGKNTERKPSADERKFFWKRLKRSLENIGLNPYPTARESHA